MVCKILIDMCDCKLYYLAKKEVEKAMPRISQFFGILIYMYYNDHMPPHFHAKWAEQEVIIQIGTIKVYTGSLPRPQLDLVLRWAILHNEELKNNWELARKGEPLKQIAPLVEK